VSSFPLFAVLHLKPINKSALMIFNLLQRATSHFKTGTFRGEGVVEAPPAFQAGCSDCIYLCCAFSSYISNKGGLAYILQSS
jgi:hypothetical protein